MRPYRNACNRFPQSCLPTDLLRSWWFVYQLQQLSVFLHGHKTSDILKADQVGPLGEVVPTLGISLSGLDISKLLRSRLDT